MEPIIKVDNVSMCFNLSKEKHESLKEYFLAMVQGRLQYDEFYALKDVSLQEKQGASAHGQGQSPHYCDARRDPIPGNDRRLGNEAAAY